MTNNEITPEYVMKYLRDEHNMDNPEIKAIENVFNTMKKYGNNRWWESEDDAIIGFYQLFENTLIVPPKKIMNGLLKLLDRPVYSHELFFHDAKEQLKKEALEAKELYLAGIKHSDEYRQEKVNTVIDDLEKSLRKNNVNFKKIDSRSKPFSQYDPPKPNE